MTESVTARKTGIEITFDVTSKLNSQDMIELYDRRYNTFEACGLLDINLDSEPPVRRAFQQLEALPDVRRIKWTVPRFDKPASRTTAVSLCTNIDADIEHVMAEATKVIQQEIECFHATEKGAFMSLYSCLYDPTKSVLEQAAPFIESMKLSNTEYVKLIHAIHATTTARRNTQEDKQFPVIFSGDLMMIGILI